MVPSLPVACAVIVILSTPASFTSLVSKVNFYSALETVKYEGVGDADQVIALPHVVSVKE